MKNFLFFDVGNSRLKIGIATSVNRLLVRSLPLNRNENPHSLGLKLFSLFAELRLRETDCVALVCSVVPDFTDKLQKAVELYFNCPVFIAGKDFFPPIVNLYEAKEELGMDRLMACYAARMLFPEIPGLIVVDFGTAITFDCVVENSFQGGLIFPGMHLAAWALAEKTAKLPLINISDMTIGSIPGKNTHNCLQNGLLIGYSELIHGICKKLSMSMPKPLKIICSGGEGEQFIKLTKIFDYFIPELTLGGLEIFSRNSKKTFVCEHPENKFDQESI